MLQARNPEWTSLHVLDLFAGSGALGLEALSRGAAGAVFVEKNPAAAGILRENLQLLNIPGNKAVVVQKDAGKYVGHKAGQSFGLVFVDPPYGMSLLSRVVPKVVDNAWLDSKGVLCAEVEVKLEVFQEEFPGLALIKNKHYGQTRILMWERTS